MRTRSRQTRNKLNEHSVLVLNATYEPIHIASAKRVMNLLVKGVAKIEIAHEGRYIHRDFKLPSVVRLTNYRRIPHIKVTPHRNNVLLRDGYTCQYCGVEFPARQLTLDHVVPRAHGGLSTWENLVACCQPCNAKKADRTPEQAGMLLLNKPRQLTIHTSRGMLRKMGSTDPNWRQYLYH